MTSENLNIRVRDAIKNLARQITRHDVHAMAESAADLQSRYLATRPTPLRAEGFAFMLCLLSDHIARRYESAPLYSIARIAATIQYLDRKFDIVPDFIQAIGKIDDNIALDEALALLADDLKAYRHWKSSHVQ